MSNISINHLSNQDLVSLFTYLPSKDLQLVCHRWMNICTTYFPKKYHLILEDITLNGCSTPVGLFKSSKKVFEILTLSNVELDLSDNHDFTEVFLFMKRLHESVTDLRLKNSIKPNIDLIRGFQNVTKMEITTPGWYLEIANKKVTFPEVKVLRLCGFNIEIFGKNLFASFFKKFSYVEEIEIEGDVIENYTQFGTFFGRKLKEIHFNIENDQLATKTMEFLTIIKGIELRTLTFVISNVYHADILQRLIMAHHSSLNDVCVIAKHGILPYPHPLITSCEISLNDEMMSGLKHLESFHGLKSIAVRFPWKLHHVQINCFFGHEFIEPNPDVNSLQLSGFNKNCPTCFTNMTITYQNLTVFEYTAAAPIDLDIVQLIGKNLPGLEELTLIYKNYDNSSKPGFAKHFENWPKLPKLKKAKFEPISWQWSPDGLTNFCNSCPLLKTLHLDGGADIDDTFLQPLMTNLHHLQYLTIGDTHSRGFDIPTLGFLFPEEMKVESCDIPLVQNYQQPCPKLMELRLLTCHFDVALKFKLFQCFKLLRTVQDRKTLSTSKEFHERKEQLRQDAGETRVHGGRRGVRVKRFLRNCCC